MNSLNPSHSSSHCPLGYAEKKPPATAALYSAPPPTAAGMSSPSPVVCYEYTYSHQGSNGSDTNSNSLKKGFAAPVAVTATPFFANAAADSLRPLSEHYYEQPMRVLAPSHPSPAAASSCSHRSNCSAASSGGGLPFSLGLPRWADDPAQVAWTRVGEAGTRVTIPRSAVSLTVPQGAIEPGRTEEVWISVLGSNSSSCDGVQLRPSLKAGQVLIAPVVVVGPPHLSAHLRKPVVVSIPHSGGAALRQVTVLQCDRFDGSSAAAVWNVVAVSDEEDTTSSTSVYKDATMCQLVTERLAAFALATSAADLLASSSCTIRTNSTVAAVSSQSSSSGCSSIGSSPTTLTPLSLASSTSSSPPFRIPSHVKAALCRLLDPTASSEAGGGDWRQLAERLGVDRYVGFFAGQPSPTEAILNLWEARHRESTAVAGLVNILRGMGRSDAAQILDQDASWP
jgi:ZU5 domain/Death domain